MIIVITILLYLSIGCVIMGIYGDINNMSVPYSKGADEEESAILIAILFFYPIIIIEWMLISLYKSLKLLQQESPKLTGQRAFVFLLMEEDRDGDGFFSPKGVVTPNQMLCKDTTEIGNVSFPLRSIWHFAYSVTKIQ